MVASLEGELIGYFSNMRGYSYSVFYVGYWVTMIVTVNQR